MTDVLIQIFSYFAYLTGIEGSIWKYRSYGDDAILLIAVVLLFFGFMAFRIISSTMVFGMITIVICRLFEAYISWGSVVTAFAVIGVITAFLLYLAPYFEGGVFCIVLGGIAGWNISESIPGMLIGAFLGMIMFCLIPVSGICAISAVTGAVLLSESEKFPIPLMVVIFCICFFFQLFISRRQKIFSKRCPEKLTDFFHEVERTLKKC
jgi:hypothetical protein